MSRGVSSKITFKTYDQSERWLLPPSLEELVPENHLVRVVSATVDQIELKALFEAYNTGGGASRYHPQMLLKVLLSDRHLFVAADCETMPRKCECDVASGKPKAGL